MQFWTEQYDADQGVLDDHVERLRDFLASLEASEGEGYTPLSILHELEEVTSA